MKASPAAFDLIKKWEGCKLLPYQDQGGVWTVGYGSTSDVDPGVPISQAEAESRLCEEIEAWEKCINSAVLAQLTQNEFDALVSFVHNIGCAAFRKSTMLAKINASDYDGAAQEFLKWDHVNGKEVDGLKNRRYAEQRLFESA